MIKYFQAYWFKPAPLFDLAVVRLVAVGLQLFIVLRLPLDAYRSFTAFPDVYFLPLPVLRVLLWVFGLEGNPQFEVIEVVWYITAVSGCLALIGLVTNLSLAVFAVGNVFLHAYWGSFDLHHAEAVMMIALSALALSPAGRVLSVDGWLRRRFWPATNGGTESVRRAESEFARWPILLLQWFFVLMYLSASYSKLTNSGWEWMNGYTLQGILIRDGLRWDSPLAVWFAQFHILIYALSHIVVLFQATFALAVIFPKLRWIYVPLGVGLHMMIYLTLEAPFFQWIALYAVFLPWSEAVDRLRLKAGVAKEAPG